MISFKYTKTDGAEFISHLDTLRHIDRTLRRAGIELKKSEGFNKHPKIFMNNPLATGVKSFAEYCSIDTDFEGAFGELFNKFSPRGIKCLKWQYAANNGNYANTIVRCGYICEGLDNVDCGAVSAEKEIIITDFRNRSVDIRPRIFELEKKDGGLYFVLGCGENNLRPDLFCAYLEQRFGGSAANITKLESFGENVF